MKITALLFSIFLLFACDGDDPNPLGDVTKQQWFKDLQVPCKKNDTCKTGIMQGLYLDDTIVYFNYLGGGYCDPFFFVRLYNGQGEIVKEYDENNPFDFGKEVTDYKTVWNCTCGYIIINGTCFYN